MIRIVAGMILVALIMATGVVYGQNYPTRPIRIVTSLAGGGNDLAARFIAQGMVAGGSLGQNVIVENRATNVIGEVVARASPDGYTLILGGGALWLAPFLRDNLRYDPIKDFTPISLAVSTPNVLVVHPSLPTNSVKEFIALAKAKPGVLNYAISGVGTINHLAAELFRSMAGVDIVRVGYSGSGAAVVDLVGGRVQCMFASASSVAVHIKSDRLRALAVTSAQPSIALPGVPTIASSGLPGYEAVSMFGLFAPTKTPDTSITRLNQEIERALNRPDTKEKLLNLGMEPVGGTPAQLATAVKSEMARMGKVIKDAGIRDE